MEAAESAGQRLRKLPYYMGSVITLVLALSTRSWLRLLPWSRRKVVVLRNGVTLEVPELLDLLLLKETICDDSYRLGELAADTRLIVDVGAGIGDFTVFAASRFVRALVLAYEPNPEAFAVLLRNIDRNRLSNVSARCIAVGTRAAYTLGLGRWSAETQTRQVGKSASTVAGARLDELIGPRSVDLVKIDCEGAELDVLESLGDSLVRVKRIAVEYHDHLVEDAGKRIEHLLRDHEYIVTRMPDRYDKRIGYVYARAVSPGR